MKITEILEQIPGLKRDQLDYWERRGYIRARKVHRGEKVVREFSQDEFEKIKLLYEYARLGYSPEEASIRAKDEMLKMKAFPFQDFLLYDGKTLKSALVESLRKSGSLPSPDAFNPDNPQVKGLIENSYPELTPANAYLAARKLLELSRDDLVKLDAVVVFDQTAAVVAGACSALSYQAVSHFPPITVFDKKALSRLERGWRVCLIMWMPRGISDILDKLAEVENQGCRIEKVVTIFASEKEIQKLQRKDRNVIRLFAKEELLR